jgi:8-oxo-dGTP pyrophosphatase MutT (NUDIX family)
MGSQRGEPEASVLPPDHRVVFEGRHFRVVREEVRLERGIETFEYVWRIDGARIVARDGGRVLLTREYRHEIGGYDWRLPGGKLDREETPLQGAEREFREETGFYGGSWQYLWSTTPDSTVRYRRHFFLVTSPSAGPDAPDPGEDLSAHWLPVATACEYALNGQVREEISALAILRICQPCENDDSGAGPNVL